MSIKMKSRYNGLIVPYGYTEEDAYISFYHIKYSDEKMNDPKFGEYFFEQDILGLLQYSNIEEADIIIIDQIYVNKIAKPIIEYTCKLHRGCKSVWPEEAFKAKADEDDFQPDKNPEEEVSKDNEG